MLRSTGFVRSIRQRKSIAASIVVMVTALVCGLIALPTANAATITDATNKTFTSSGGTSGKYHVYGSSVDTSKPFGVLLQFHGDGAYEFKNPTSTYSLGGSTGITAVGKANNLIVIPMLTPDSGLTWWEEGSQNADYVADFLNKVVYGEYGVDKNHVWLVGYSGGAQFITQFFIPKYASLIGGGGSIVFGGGGKPVAKATAIPESWKTSFPMHWYTGSQDIAANSDEGYDALSYARAGYEYYKSQGLTVSIETPNVTHEIDGKFGPAVAAFFAKSPPLANNQAGAKQTSSPSSQPATKPSTKPSTVKSATATLSANFVQPSSIAITGAGFPAGTTVNCSADVTVITSVTATVSQDGTFKATMTVPNGFAGKVLVTARAKLQK